MVSKKNMKLLFENWRKFINEEASSEDIEDVVVDVLKDEGGAAGLEPIENALGELDLPEDFDLEEFLKALDGVGQHEEGDYILFYTKDNDNKQILIKRDDEETKVSMDDIKEGVQIFLEMKEDSIDEGKKDPCYHKVKSRYKVWPSAYASGALVKCRNVGAKNWGTGKKKKRKKKRKSRKK
tara:strand:- start:77 stop:619 length:543 start_codon:yes stop_codon:yes gene_type:complete